MNIQNRINKIKDEFKSNAALRAEWETVVQSESYSKICELVYLEATVRAAQSSPIAEHDAMAARKLFKLQAVQETLKSLSEAHYPQATVSELPDGWDHYKPEDTDSTES
jgi:hypothetical protein